MSRGCLKGVWRVSIRCPNGLCGVYKYLKGKSGLVKSGHRILNPKFFWTYIFWFQNFWSKTPPDNFDFFESGKNWKFNAPPDLIGKILNFGNPPSGGKNISLKHLKLPKNHFKTNLFFV